MERHFKYVLYALVVLGSAASPTTQARDAPPAGVIFENVRIFDGTSARLSGPSNVLTVGEVIKTISSAPIADPPGITMTRIQGNGRTLMPGLIDSHWHTMFAAPSMFQLIEGDLGYLTFLASAEAEATLMRGFTTVRDLGGPSFALKRAIDEGVVVGPRIYPSGAMITITGGHGDFRIPADLPRSLGGPQTQMERLNASQPPASALTHTAVGRGSIRGRPRAALGDVLTGTQPTDPMIFRYWSSPNALRVVVRMLPPLAIEMASLANSSSFGASMMTTMS